MTTPLEIRTGLKTNLLAAVKGAQVTGYQLGSPTAPGFSIGLSGVEYDLAMGRGLDKWTWSVQGFVALVSDRAAQVNLDLWLASTGDKSVKAAIEADSTLGGAVYDASVTSATPRIFVSSANANLSYLGAEWIVEILADGS